jgi:hypothetical protein
MSIVLTTTLAKWSPALLALVAKPPPKIAMIAALALLIHAFPLAPHLAASIPLFPAISANSLLQLFVPLVPAKPKSATLPLVPVLPLPSTVMTATFALTTAVTAPPTLAYTLPRTVTMEMLAQLTFAHPLPMLLLELPKDATTTESTPLLTVMITTLAPLTLATLLLVA